MENTKYSKYSFSLGYWIENPILKYSSYFWNIRDKNRDVSLGCISVDDLGVCPVIEVPKLNIEY